MENSKDVLIDNLQRTLILTKEKEKLKNTRFYYSFIDIPVKVLMATHVFLYILLLIVSYKIFNTIDRLINSNSDFLLLLFWVGILGLPYLVVKFLPTKIISSLEKNKQQANKHIIDKAYSREFKIDSLLNEYSVIPSDYRNPYAINSFISYLENQRADTLKEAINLFESDIRHIERMKELEKIKYNQHEIMRQVQEVHQTAKNTEALSWFNVFTK